MITNFKAPKGTQDILPNEIILWRKIEKIGRKVCSNFNFDEIKTPTFESEHLFNRSIGDSTDIVEKEMFRFTDLAKRPLALRPEGTASVVRAIIEHGLLNEPMPLKLFYFINCFRNERPQAGRFKEFHQFGTELFGSTNPLSDVEIISLINQFFGELNLKNINLEINSIGCARCRKMFRQKFVEFYENKKNLICPTCLNRLQKNPIRILDCKIQQCIQISENAPKTTQNLCKECQNHFEIMCDLLASEKIEFEINPCIVRGLDYYTKTVFEFQSNELGAQKTICGGGRYDNLVETMSNVPLSGLGCAVGIERLIMLLKAQNNPITKNKKSCCLFMGNFNSTAKQSMKIALNLRRMGLNVEINLLNRSVKSQMKYANKLGADFSCILGENEILNNNIQLKNMTTKQVFEINLNSFEEQFLNIIAENKP